MLYLCHWDNFVLGLLEGILIMLKSTEIVLQAAKNRNAWGKLNARRFVINRGVDVRLYRLACQLENAKKAGF